MEDIAWPESLKLARDRAGLTWGGLGKLLGVPAGTVNAWYCEGRIPRFTKDRRRLAYFMKSRGFITSTPADVCHALPSVLPPPALDEPFHRGDLPVSLNSIRGHDTETCKCADCVAAENRILAHLARVQANLAQLPDDRDILSEHTMAGNWGAEDKARVGEYRHVWARGERSHPMHRIRDAVRASSELNKITDPKLLDEWDKTYGGTRKESA